MFVVILLVLAFLLPQPGVAQQRGRGAGPPQTPQQAAAIDLTGYWVSVVTEDWRVRMVTPPKGYYESVPMTAEARKVADAWDPAKDEAAGNQCKAYGGAAIMRMPGRLHFTWKDPNTLQMDVDAGTQTRVFHFDSKQAPAGTGKSLQGYSVAEWEYAGRGQPRKGNLKITTTNLQAGYLRKNGVPYSENATVTEYFDLLKAPNGDTWLLVVSEVTDPQYLNPSFITSTQFKKQADATGWNPTACSAR